MRSWKLALSSLVALLGLVVSISARAADPSCSAPIPPTPSGGCYLTLTTATNCQTLDAGTTGYYEFAWSTSGSFCESPMKILITGSPPDSWLYGNNYLLYTISSGTSNWYWLDRRIGGYILVSPNALAQLTTDNGQYTWGVQSYYGSGSGSGVFRLKSAGSPTSSGTTDSDRVFNWAESKYAQFFKPSGAASQSAFGYYFRYYAQTDVYLGSAGGKLFVYGAQIFGPSILDLGPLSTWLSQAQAAGY